MYFASASAQGTVQGRRGRETLRIVVRFGEMVRFRSEFVNIHGMVCHLAGGGDENHKTLPRTLLTKNRILNERENE